MIILIFNILLSVAYVALSVWATRGIPVSLSATYYTLGRFGWIFQLVMFSIGFTLPVVWLDVTEYKPLAFFSCGSLLFVASAPLYRLPLQGKVHYSAAIICCVSAVLWQILEGLWDVTLLFGFLGGMLALQWKEQYMWWIEMAVIGSLFCNLMRVL